MSREPGSAGAPPAGRSEASPITAPAHNGVSEARIVVALGAWWDMACRTGMHGPCPAVWGARRGEPRHFRPLGRPDGGPPWSREGAGAFVDRPAWTLWPNAAGSGEFPGMGFP